MLINERRVLLDVAVDPQNLARNGRVDISCYLDALDYDCALGLFEGLAHRRELDVDNLTQLLLRVVGDADFGHLLPWAEFDPLVAFGVLAR